MSIASQILTLNQDKLDIQNALVSKSVFSATGSGYDSFSTDILQVSQSVEYRTGSLDLRTGIRFGSSSFTSLPQIVQDANWHEVTNFWNMFDDCQNLVSMSFIDTSGAVSFHGMFSYCTHLAYVPPLSSSGVTDFSNMFLGCHLLYRQGLPSLDTSNGINFRGMFADTWRLFDLSDYTLNTSNGVDFSSMFYYCMNLQYLPTLDTSKGENFESMFGECPYLVQVPKLNFSSASNVDNLFRIGGDNPNPDYFYPNLTYLGGFTGLTLSLDLRYCKALSPSSVRNVIVEAGQGNGATLLTLHSDVFTAVTQQDPTLFSDAANKGWIIQSS